MGWLCTECGTENQFREAHCRACLRRGNIAAYVIGACVTLYERCDAHRLGRFAESVWDKESRIIGRLHRIGKIMTTVCAAVSIALALAAPGGAVRSGNVQLCLERLGVHCAETINMLEVRIAQRIEEIQSDVDSFPQTWDVEILSERLGRIGSNADALVDRLQAAAERSEQRMARLDRTLVQEMPRMDIHIVSWMINRMYELYSWLCGLNIEWLDGLGKGVLTAGEYLAKLSGWLQSLRG